MNKLYAFFTPARRRYFYNLSITLVAAAGTLGYITDEAAPQIIAIVGALLAITTASANVPKYDKKSEPREDADTITNADSDENAQEPAAVATMGSTVADDTVVDSDESTEDIYLTVDEDYNYDDYEGGVEIMVEDEHHEPEPITDEEIESYDESDESDY